MRMRFRIRTRSGEELEVGSLSGLCERVQAGDVGPDDFIFDALTHEWVPARVHLVYRLATELPGRGEQPRVPEEPASGALPVSGR